MMQFDGVTAKLDLSGIHLAHEQEIRFQAKSA